MVYAQLTNEFNDMMSKRRLRLNAVSDSLPSTVWFILIFGAFINIALTWLLVIGNKKLDITINVLSGLLFGSLIFLIAAMDNPFRGEYSITSEPFQELLNGLMN